jgi:serine/threonine protein phosphatase PrpC
MDPKMAGGKLAEPDESGGASGFRGREVAQELLDDDPDLAEALDDRVRMGAATQCDREPKKPSGDRYAYDERGWMAVCDGVGSTGHDYEAAQLAIDFLHERLETLDTSGGRAETERALRELLLEAHEFMRAEQQRIPKIASTASIVRLVEEDGQIYAVIGNLGDTPVYLERDGQLTELTNFHTYVPPDKAQRPALGKPLEPAPQVWSVQLRPGDRLVVASNGLRKNDGDMSRMGEILQEERDPDIAAQRLVTELKGESDDARTAIVMNVRWSVGV